MDPKKPIVHEDELPSEPSSTEFFLPKPDLPTAVRTSLAPWFASLADASPEHLNALVADRFAIPAKPELQPLCDQLSSWKPVSIIVQNDKCWLRLDSSHDSDVDGTSAFVPCMPDESVLRCKLSAAGHDNDEIFVAFLTHFAGLAEDFACSGNFIVAAETFSTISEDWQKTMIDNFDEWRGALIIYHARNGDQLLLHPSGSVGWWRHEENLVTKEFASFSEFLKFYVKYREETPWPLDAYGPPEYARNRK